MKKSLSIVLTVFMLVCVFVPVTGAAERPIEHANYGVIIDGISFDGNDIWGEFEGYSDYCFIRNEYYEHFADYYFEKQYDFYKEAYDYWTGEKTDIWFARQTEFTQDSKGNNKTFAYDETPDKMNGHIYYQTVIFNYDGEPDAEKNMALAEALSEGMEVLYVGTTTPCAVVAIRGGTNDFTNVVENENVEFFFIAFSDSDVTFVNLSIFEETYSPNASHARRILRYSAGLEKVPENPSEAKEFLFMSDTDFDGKLTSSDARTALRISAGLEKGYTFYNSDSGAGAWWEF